MKQYKLRPGVVLTEVCGEYLLIATKEAKAFCPFVTQINEQAAAFWRILEKANTAPKILDQAAVVMGKEKKDVLVSWLAFLSKMSKAGYILAEEAE